MSRWTVEDADGFQAVDPAATDEDLAIAECYDDKKNEYDGSNIREAS